MQTLSPFQEMQQAKAGKPKVGRPRRYPEMVRALITKGKVRNMANRRAGAVLKFKYRDEYNALVREENRALNQHLVDLYNTGEYTSSEELLAAFYESIDQR